MAERFNAQVESFSTQLDTIRASGAAPALLDSVQVLFNCEKQNDDKGNDFYASAATHR